MFGLTDKIIGALALVLALALAWQTYQLSSERTEHSALKLQVAQDKERRAAAALKAEQQTAASESTHAQKTQENSDAFTTSQPVRDAIARADRARVDAVLAERVRREQAGRAATNRAIAQACAASAGDIANRLDALDDQLTKGIGVVADLRKDLGRRDAEVVLLHGQIVADRALIADGPATSGLGMR